MKSAVTPVEKSKAPQTAPSRVIPIKEVARPTAGAANGTTDIIFLTGLLIISALALFLFTAIGGRLWCGYACPQTVYTEIFMWIERHIEGDRNARMRLDAKALAKWWPRKAAKHALWI